MTLQIKKVHLKVYADTFNSYIKTYENPEDIVEQNDVRSATERAAHELGTELIRLACKTTATIIMLICILKIRH